MTSMQLLLIQTLAAEARPRYSALFFAISIVSTTCLLFSSSSYATTSSSPISSQASITISVEIPERVAVESTDNEIVIEEEGNQFNRRLCIKANQPSGTYNVTAYTDNQRGFILNNGNQQLHFKVLWNNTALKIGETLTNQKGSRKANCADGTGRANLAIQLPQRNSIRGRLGNYLGKMRLLLQST